MKKFCQLFLLAALGVLLSGCGSSYESSSSQSQSYYYEENTPVYEEEADEDYFEIYETPDSSCFSEIGYNSYYEVLYVNFRTSGGYLYFDFPEDAWIDFFNADSLGSWHNDYIKGYYEYERLD